jgi:hypothetical protein
MPEKSAIRRARKDASEGKAPTTQAGEFIREEIHHIREGVHGARSAKQAIAIGLSKARRAGVALPPKPGTKASASTARTRAASSESSATRARVALATKAVATKGRTGLRKAAKKAAATRRQGR